MARSRRARSSRGRTRAGCYVRAARAASASWAQTVNDPQRARIWRVTALQDGVKLRSLSDVQPRIWVTLPTFNEAGNIERVVRSVLAELERAAPGDHSVL